MMWLQLKLQMLPIVAVEINNKINEYKHIINLLNETQDTQNNQNIINYITMNNVGSRQSLNHANAGNDERQQLLIMYS